MSCNEIRTLLNSTRREQDAASIAAHIRSCPRCRNGIVRFSQALLADDPLSCDACCTRFPTYYEATRPAYALVAMAATELAAIAFHLGRCSSCREEYQAFMLLAELDERGEMV